jgi:murein DD-endopeptidase MepM/ murein hydrolase activator NlpD
MGCTLKRWRPAWLLLLLVLSLLGLPAEQGATAVPMPPQLPSPAEMEQLQRQMQASLAKVQQAQGALDQVVKDYEAAQTRLSELVAAGAASSAQLDALGGEYRAAKAQMNLRAAEVYRSERLEMLGVLVSARTFREFLTAFELLQNVSENDATILKRVTDLKTAQEAVHTELERQRAEQQQAIAEIASRQAQVESSLQAVNREYSKVKAEMDKRKSGFAFPIRGAYSYANTFGAPRYVGGEYDHKHQGTDIFALRGTPLVAVVDGVVERVGNDRLGGIKLWLRSPGDNWTYYYAHLSGYAKGIRNGLRVKKGDVLGYVGNTGNAKTTPSHVHFETHVPSGAVVNSYFVLRRCDPLAR